MLPSTTETQEKQQAQRAATLAATWRQVQGGAATLAWQHQQMQQQENDVVTMGTTAMATELEMQRNQARIVVASSEGAPAAAEEQKKQEPAALERLAQWQSAVSLNNAWLVSKSGVGIILALFYINFHAIMRGFGIKRFCALGEEGWLIKAIPAATLVGPSVLSEPPPGTRLKGWGELGAIVFIDFALLLTILLQFAFMAVVVSAVMDPWDTFKQYGFAPFKIIWDLINGS